MSRNDPAQDRPYEEAGEQALEEYTEWFEADPEMRARRARTREAEKNGEGPVNPVSVEKLITQADEARRVRAARPRRSIRGL